jgi:hypothetical protein
MSKSVIVTSFKSLVSRCWTDRRCLAAGPPADSLTAYDKAWVSTLNARPSLGAALSGWYPRKMSLVDGMDVYWSSYLASKEQGRS